MISHKHRCIFVHIPKTAGSTIEHVFWPTRRDKTVENLWGGFIDEHRNKYQTDGLQHLLASQIRLEVGEEIFDQYFKFSFVRNPWDKAVSEYRSLLAHSNMREFIGMPDNIDFKAHLSFIQKTRHTHWEPQHHFLYADNGELMVDFVGRFEQLEEDTLRMLKRMRREKYPLRMRALLHAVGIKKLPHKNKKNIAKQHYSEMYDDESRQIVEDMYKRDIELFGYRFETPES